MTQLRIAMITRRFWPLVGGAETMMANLNRQFRRRGVEATVVTGQWHPEWPLEMRLHETPIVRLPSPRLQGWGTIRYMRALSRWLRRNRDRFDAVCVSRLRYDAYATLTALRGQDAPVVVRCESSGETGDCHWLRDARFGKRMRRTIGEADALVAPTERIADELREMEFPESKIRVIPNGTPLAAAPTPTARLEARAALAEANRDLFVPPAAPVILWVGRMHRSRRLHDLVRAFREIRRRHVNAHLWLIGDGPQREAVYRRLIDAQLHRQALMPGVFDDMHELMAAADLFVATNDQDACPIGLLEAMAHGLPVVAPDLAENRQLLQQGQAGKLVVPGDINTLAESVCELLEDPAGATKLGQAARRVMQQRSLARTADTHLELMQSFLKPRTAPSP